MAPAATVGARNAEFFFVVLLIHLWCPSRHRHRRHAPRGEAAAASRRSGPDDRGEGLVHHLARPRGGADRRNGVDDHRVAISVGAITEDRTLCGTASPSDDGRRLCGGGRGRHRQDIASGGTASIANTTSDAASGDAAGATTTATTTAATATTTAAAATMAADRHRHCTAQAGLHDSDAERARKTDPPHHDGRRFRREDPCDGAARQRERWASRAV